MTFSVSPFWTRLTGEPVILAEMKKLSLLTLGTLTHKTRGGGVGVGPYKHNRSVANKTLVKMVAMYWGGGVGEPWITLKTGVRFTKILLLDSYCPKQHAVKRS